jgi:very-short-patch-repair endonuclease
MRSWILARTPFVTGVSHMGNDWFSQMLARSEDFLTQVLEQYPIQLHDVESPIEQMMGAALWAWCGVADRFDYFEGYIFRYDTVEVQLECLSRSKKHANIGMQTKVGSYTADFLIAHIAGINGFGGVVVECDGHNYHERTKEQAAHDRRRDRELQERGFKVARFTGSEIWADPFGCAAQALAMANEEVVDAAHARSLLRAGDMAGVINALRAPLSPRAADEPF